MANSQQVGGRVLGSVPIYSSAGTKTKRVCENVEVPVYAKGGAQAGDVLAGAFIGGVLGKILAGKDSRVAFGAVAGGAVAAGANQNRIVDYRTERIG